MKKFLVLYRAPISAREQMAQATPEQAKAGMALWTTWLEKHASAIKDIGAPLDSGRHAAAGSVGDGDATITGYSIVESESMTGAQEMLRDHPHFHVPGGSIEVLEFLSMPAR